MTHPVTIPLINPNEPEALLATLFVSEGLEVVEGDLLCTLETTKSTVDFPADKSGFVVGLRLGEGVTVRAGDLLCYLADSADWKPAENSKGDPTKPQGQPIPDGLRITKPALVLAVENNLDLRQLPVGDLVTIGFVRELIRKSKSGVLVLPKSDFDPVAIIIYGGGGHGKAIFDMLRFLGTYRVVGFVDDGIAAGEEIMGAPVLGGSEVLADLHREGIRLAVNAVGGIGDVSVRVKVFNLLAENGFVCPAVLHPTAFIEQSAELSAGVQIFPQAYVGSEAKVGYGSIINTGAIVSHECVLGNYVNISPGVILAGQVEIGDGALIGMGVTVNLQAKIGAGARIGNGATVKTDVPDQGIVRAGSVWPE
jgi:acetyltransferase EpsM